ncbi:3-phosphoshikimate 1-carboxyvinyltransferase [Flavobacterium subsaxonicum]|uniref:3-phosphoshikimate 1-carboxyvinyltransferase n=1 Tax=Flavobacterium subsaxonicum WB 4.1-42 = DSM 21790 TaxID=1121898 RepID=A0A0A2MRL9_9FLAO|nr:3-phosphoshikimate 1-carboxyvinyltransferase [Flavobacterium subsaxonicum]KGO94196.1 3-phosphoshikimate 1-carboxyvinyltransferase [Flavobacterium subsaxonicum WB 4.1-42 = DSM 21790]
MDIKLNLNTSVHSTAIKITGSKSETNRLLLLQALYPGITINNISESDDSTVMQQALAGSEAIVDIHHAGTAMRFLTAYFALQEGKEVVLTGSQRMKERPIAVLVDALRSLGAQIEYTENEGYPPIKITGKKLTQSKVAMKANVSSQYITALLLVAGRLENGLELTLEGELTSIPYINMTLSLLKEVGIATTFKGNVITVKPATNNQQPATITVESDWSSASYFYSIVALADVGTAIVLSSYKQNSLQGDSALSEIYAEMGVETTFKNNSIVLKKLNHQLSALSFELNNTPDIAQTIAVTCFGLGIGCYLTGLHTLKIKETDRLEALKTELSKFGAKISVTDDSLALEAGFNPPASPVAVATYNDHRMAMAFAPLAIKTPVIINDAGVVSKSYPTFWHDMQALGFVVNEL